VATGVVVALALAAPGTVRAQSLGTVLLDPDVRMIRSVSIPVEMRGSLAVDFHADTAAGCPLPCALEGRLLWAPAAAAELSVYEVSEHGRREMYGTLFTFGARTTVTVTRTLPGLRSCSDLRAERFLSLDFSAHAGDHIDVGIADGPDAEPDGEVLSTRCFGPREIDVAPVLPVRRLDRAALRRGQTTIDLSAEGSFTGRGVAGSVRSSIALVLGRPEVDSSRDEVRLGEGSHRGRPRYRTTIATYRIERVAGRLVAGFRGSGEPALCSSLDSCGASGTVSASPAASSGDALFRASGPVRRSRRQLEAALGLIRGRRAGRIDASGYALWNDRGRVAESFVNGDGQACTDDGPLGSGSLSFEITGRRAVASYVAGGFFTGDPFRTRCPGPTFNDVTAGGEPVIGSVPLSAFRKRRVRMSLARADSFETDAYTGQFEPALELVMRRVGVETRVSTEPGL
jgi:hypothetical protein